MKTLPSKEEVTKALSQYRDIKSIEVINNTIIVRPIGYIKDKGIWQAITNTVASLGGKYVPKTNDNTWQIPMIRQGFNPNMQGAKASQFVPGDPLMVTKHIDDIILSLEALKREVDSMLKH